MKIFKNGRIARKGKEEKEKFTENLQLKTEKAFKLFPSKEFIF